MSHEWHAKQLLAAIRNIDDFIASCADDGAVPLLDAVETSRLLKSLVCGTGMYRPDAESARRRMARAGSRFAAVRAQVINAGWEPACPRCKSLVAGGRKLDDALLRERKAKRHNEESA